jgi:glycosyltransferase involved in cell wall biosynthesis
MKILHVIPNLLKGGAQRLVIDICIELSKNPTLDCKILVLSKSVNEFQYCSSKLDITFCKVKFQLSMLKKNQINIDSYENFIDDFKPDIIHSHLYFSELVCHENPRSNIKYVSHLHSNRTEFKPKNLSNFFHKKTYFQLFEKIRLVNKYKKATKKFISISSDTYSFFKSNFHQQSKNLVSLPNALNFQRFKAEIKDPSYKKISLITVGNLLVKKNHIFLLDVVSYLKRKQVSVTLKIIGDGIERERISTKIHKLRLEPNVTLCGQLDLVEKHLKKADFYVHSATYEPFGLVILEAMASGLPVISLNGSGNADIIKDKINGYLIKDQDPVKFGDVILDLFQNKEKYKSISKKGFETCANYDIKNYVPQLLKIYKSQ